jgi:hypothetical protein
VTATWSGSSGSLVSWEKARSPQKIKNNTTENTIPETKPIVPKIDSFSVTPWQWEEF